MCPALDVRGCVVWRQEFRGILGANAVFAGADLTATSFFQADLAGADFSGANLAGASLEEAGSEPRVYSEYSLGRWHARSSCRTAPIPTAVGLTGAVLENAVLESAYLTRTIAEAKTIK